MVQEGGRVKCKQAAGCLCMAAVAIDHFLCCSYVPTWLLERMGLLEQPPHCQVSSAVLGGQVLCICWFGQAPGVGGGDNVVMG